MSEHPNWIHTPPNKELADFIQRYLQALSPELVVGLNHVFHDRPELLSEFYFTLETSQFVKSELLRCPWILPSLLSDNSLPGTRDTINAFVAERLAPLPATEELVFDQALRELRALAMVNIIWQDINRQTSFEQTTCALSLLATQCLNLALDYHYRGLCQKHGTPRSTIKAEPQPMLILGMGKLGAAELNLSSDIDLIFAYPEKGDTDHPDKPLSNQDFFTRLGKKIIYSLDNKSASGFVFRVDMRLRPYGQSGALVYCFDALEEYYQSQGREWERYAMIKASVVANNGPEAYSDTLMSMLRSFTYRKYIDFSVIQALRNLKKIITQEIKRRRIEEDIKLGSGGIREIEFTAQVFQLIRGGREAQLRDNRLLKILPALAELKCLPKEHADDLAAAYIFLRNTEHAIQAYRDEQTQSLPNDTMARNALTRIMGFENWEDFYQSLNQHRELVKKVFADVIASPEESDSSDKDASVWVPVWQMQLDKNTAIKQLRDAGYENPEFSFELLSESMKWANNSSMHTTSLARLDEFMPLLLATLSQFRAPSETLKRLIKLIKAVVRRSAYLLLLMENPGALRQLVKLTQASPWIGDRLAEHPALLDELLDPNELYNQPLKNELHTDLRRTLLRIPEDDLEAQMDTLRYFRSAHVLRVAASEITGALPLMRVSDYLTWIAEVIVEHVLVVCWQELVKKYGYPDNETRAIPNFIVVAYGKLGGIEMGHGSDLDLVFIHGANIHGHTDGKRSIDNQTFFTRLGQKIIHFLTTNMASGALYDVDMRLRPSGNSGMLVATMASFEKYQRDSAWTWEHQALVRARVIAGDSALHQHFEQVRQGVLCQIRENKKLRADVIEMRNKMREHLGSGEKDSTRFHLKHDAGGIVDIEFMVQYGVLAWAHAHPALVTYTDNIRILESFLNSKLLAAPEVNQLIDAYKAFRTAGHRLTLQQQPSIVTAAKFESERHIVERVWQRLLGSS